VSVYGQQESPTTASLSQKNHASEQDSQTAKALEIALIRLKASEERNALLEDRLKAKDTIIEAKDGLISVRDEQLKLALEANKDRAAVNTGDARMLASCETQLAKADSEIHRLRYPGFFRSLFDFRTLSGAAVGYGIGRVTK
jgi:hypothetical protein